MNSEARQKEIQIWLIRTGKRQADIARETGASKQSVSKTIAGSRSDKRVLDWLSAQGCPAELLETSEEEAEAA